VLLADDSDADRFLTKRILTGSPRLEIIAEVENGEEAVAYLAGKDQYADRQAYPFPDLLVLDLKMPRKNGFDVLKWLRTQSFNQLVVFVLSGSDLADDIERSMQLGAAAFCTKTADPAVRCELPRKLEALLDRRAKSRSKSKTPAVQKRLNR
jgi:CheY-like chemotaxis protein